MPETSATSLGKEMETVTSTFPIGTAPTFPLPSTAATTMYTIPTTYYTGGGGGGSGSSYSLGEYSYPVSGKPLSSDDLTALASRIVTVFPEEETLLMVVDSNWSDYQISALEMIFRGMFNGPPERKGKVLIIREPKRMALVKSEKIRTESQRIDFLARIGVIWEDNPGLTFAAIIDTMMGVQRTDDMDEVMMSALELAWG
jgi:hypothetical protein